MPDPRGSAATRKLRFTLLIETELGENDEPEPTVAYVTDWLNDNGYSPTKIDQWEVARHVRPDGPWTADEEREALRRVLAELDEKKRLDVPTVLWGASTALLRMREVLDGT